LFLVLSRRPKGERRPDLQFDALNLSGSGTDVARSGLRFLLPVRPLNQSLKNPGLDGVSILSVGEMVRRGC
jgi:hypothetical protein